MPAKRRRYKPEAVRAAFEPWARGDENSDGEQRMFCPLCEHPETSRSPSASMNAEKGEWYCQKGEHGGSIYDLVQQLEKQGGFSMRGTARNETRITRKLRRPKAPPPLEDQDAPHDDHAALIHKFPEQLDYLTSQRGLSRETIERHFVGFNGERFMIPVRMGVAGPWINIRRYLPGAVGNAVDKQKMLNTPGHGSPAVLAFTGELAGNALPVILAEGEWDALLTGQQMAGRAVAITGTGGAGTPPLDLSPLAGREVFVVYDCDDSGRAGAKKIAPLLQRVGARVHILDLRRLGLPSSEGHGADLTDYWMKYGGTPEQLLEEMDRLRALPDDLDDVAAVMTAAFLDVETPQLDYTPQLLTEEDIMRRPPIRYVVEGIVPVGMTTVLFGQPGSFKTFVGQDIGNCIRAGLPWHGHDVTPGAVLLLEAEGVQQLQARILAWDKHHGSPTKAAFRALEEPLVLSTPEGAAALVRTVRGMEAETGERVALVWVDPAALYMAGSENEDGNRNLIVGLNAVAKYLDIAVILIVHTNATGERARGTDHFRMLAGSHIKVERLDGGLVGVVQEKIKNAAPRAVVLRPVEVGASVAFDTEERLTAVEYASRKHQSNWKQRATLKLSERSASRSIRDEAIADKIRAFLRGHPQASQSQVKTALLGHGAGADSIKVVLVTLVENGEVEAVPGPRNSTLYSLTDGDGL